MSKTAKASGIFRTRKEIGRALLIAAMSLGLAAATLTPLLAQEPGPRPFSPQEQQVPPPRGLGEPGMTPFAPGMAPQTLPELDKLTVSLADQDGLVTVTGATGAVPSRAAVFVLSLQTGARVRTMADEQGKFTARIAAGPVTPE